MAGDKRMACNDDDTGGKAEPFGTWLLAQTGRSGWVGDLAKAAKADRQFPRQGDPDAIRAHLNKSQADGDMFEAVDDAEGLWLGL
jgi:hypothetical protein